MGIAAAALVYAVLTALLFRNLIPGLDTHLYAYLGDPLLNAAILGWNATQLPLTGAWWSFPSFAPLSGVTAFTEHLLLAYPIASPIVWVTGNPVLAYNTVFLLSFPLNGISAYLLARELTGSAAAAFVGGLAFAFAPYHAVQMTHLQMLMAFGIPLTLLGLHRYIRHPRPSALALFACGWLCAALANAYMLVFVPVLVAMWCAWYVRPPQWRQLAALAGAAVLVVGLMAPLLWGYHVRQAEHGLGREYQEVKVFAADIAGVGRIFHRSTLWRGLLPETYEEGALFPGFTIAALAMVAVAGAIRRGGTALERSSPGSRWPRRLIIGSAAVTAIVLARVWTGPFGWHAGPLPLPPFRPYRLFTAAAILLIAAAVGSRRLRAAWTRRDTVMFYAVAACLLWGLALGPEPEWSTPWRALIAGPYRLLMELPGVQSIRVPARAWLPAALCLAMLAACGAAALAGRYPRRARLIIAVVGAAIAAEGWFFDVAVAAPRPMRAGAIPPGATVIDLPVEEAFWNAIPQYRAVLGGYRTINGYSGYEPPHFNPLRHAIAERRPGALDAYRKRADLYVIVRPGEDPSVVRWIVSSPGAEHLYDAEDARIYRLARLQQN